MSIQSQSHQFERAAASPKKYAPAGPMLSLSEVMPYQSSKPQPLQQIQEAYNLVLGTSFGKWLLDHSNVLAFSTSSSIIEGFVPHSSAMRRARDILAGIEVPNNFKQAIADATLVSYRAVLADMKIRKSLMDWPEGQPAWEDIRALAESTEAVLADTYMLAGYKTKARPIASRETPGNRTVVTLASTSGSTIYINMHPDAWKVPRTALSIVGDIFHEHHHCLQNDLIKAHRAGEIREDHHLHDSLHLLSKAGWIDVLSRKLSSDWHSAIISEKDAYYLSGIFDRYVENDGGDSVIRQKARITLAEKVLHMCGARQFTSSKPSIL
jgi:hypothetical protein